VVPFIEKTNAGEWWYVKGEGGSRNLFENSLFQNT
jgi:hypothetical protein